MRIRRHTALKSGDSHYPLNESAHSEDTNTHWELSKLLFDTELPGSRWHEKNRSRLVWHSQHRAKLQCSPEEPAKETPEALIVGGSQGYEPIKKRIAAKRLNKGLAELIKITRRCLEDLHISINPCLEDALQHPNADENALYIIAPHNHALLALHNKNRIKDKVRIDHDSRSAEGGRNAEVMVLADRRHVQGEIDRHPLRRDRADERIILWQRA